jgi:hypothetical protein
MMIVYAETYSMDKAHGIILGVNETNNVEAEFAATNRGKTSWSEDHPLNTDQDMLHSIIHRLEGGVIGEGGYTGYDNSKYWLFGGDKKYIYIDNHIVRTMFRHYVWLQHNNNGHHLQEMDLIADEIRYYENSWRRWRMKS